MLMTTLQRLKLYIGIDACDTTKDALLKMLIEDAGEEFIQITGQNDYDMAENLVCKMALIKYNRIGVEGQTSTNYNGLSESYLDGYGEEITTAIQRYKRIKTL